MNNLKQKSTTGKGANEVKPHHLGKLLEVNYNKKNHLLPDQNSNKISGIFTRNKKNFKDKFKYGVLSLKIMERDKSLF